MPDWPCTARNSRLVRCVCVRQEKRGELSSCCFSSVCETRQDIFSPCSSQQPILPTTQEVTQLRFPVAQQRLQDVCVFFLLKKTHSVKDAPAAAQLCSFVRYALVLSADKLAHPVAFFSVASGSAYQHHRWRGAGHLTWRRVNYDLQVVCNMQNIEAA